MHLINYNTNSRSQAIKVAILTLFLLFSNLDDLKAKSKTKKIKISGHEIKVEIAKTDEERSRGLMRRRQLDQNSGMLFIFDKDKLLSFWMKNTFIPLSIAFMSSNCTIVDIQKMYPHSLLIKDLPTYTSKKPAKYALEVNQGWFSKNKIKVGDKLNCKNREIVFH